MHPPDEIEEAMTEEELEKDRSSEAIPALQNKPEIQEPAYPYVAPAVDHSWLWYGTAGAFALALGAMIVLGLYLLARPLGILVLGMAISASLNPIVNRLGRRVPRVLAVILVYFMLLVFLVAVGYLIFPPIIAQFQTLIGNLPDMFSRIQQWLDSLNLQGLNLSSNNSFFSQIAPQLVGSLGSLASLPSMIFSPLFLIILILFVSIYGLIQAPSIHSFILSLFPDWRQGEVARILHATIQEMGGYLRGAAINGVIIGSFTALGMFLIGVDFPLVLGLIAGVLELIPFIGPIIASIPMVLIALLNSPTTALIALVYAVALHQFEGQILVPNIMRSQTRISPLLVLLAFTAGYLLDGAFGALVSIPLVAGLRVLTLELVVPAIRHRLEKM